MRTADRYLLNLTEYNSVTVSRELCRDRRLSFTAKALFLLMASEDLTRFKLNRTEMAAELGVSLPTLDRALANLKACGYLRVLKQRRNGRWSSCYFLSAVPTEAGTASLMSDRQQSQVMTYEDDSPTAAPTAASAETATGSAPSPTITSDSYKYYTNSTTATPRAETVTEEGKTAAAPETFTPPTEEEVQQFAESIHAKCDIRRYYLIRAGHDWKTLSGKPVTNWRLDLQLWELNERPKNTAATMNAPCAEAGAHGAGWEYSKGQRRWIYNGFQQRDHNSINFDDIEIDLDNYDPARPLMTKAERAAERAAF